MAARLLCCLLLTALLAAAACGPAAPREDAAQRRWRGPTDLVSSVGVREYDRRATAQRVAFPACLFVGDAPFSFAGVRPVEGGGLIPPGLYDTGYSADRWRLLAAGALDAQASLFVYARGSTGIVAEYTRVSGAPAC